MTAVVHDPAAFASHDQRGHAENQQRLAGIRIPADLRRIPLRPATDAELLAVHTPAHLNRVMGICAAGGGWLDQDTYTGPQSEQIVRGVVGGVIDLALSVWRGEARNGLAVVRPPGHHATAGQAMGFCLYNTVAAATAAVRDDGAARVAIVDFDVHHGNGTQDIFYEDADVLFLSTHQFPHYPFTGPAAERGRGAGLGTTVNYPLSLGAGDREFLSAWRDSLLPALAAYRPEMILVSAGYDAHEADPLAGLNVTGAGFAALGEMLLAAAAAACDGRIVFSLEGGYDPPALAACVHRTLDQLRAAAGDLL